ncbi:hypothetical protein KM043_007040 [Ampulex compressa]|nr:hypothetical protein KM043_007040 [Ampulex compressa]
MHEKAARRISNLILRRPLNLSPQHKYRPHLAYRARMVRIREDAERTHLKMKNPPALSRGIAACVALPVGTECPTNCPSNVRGSGPYDDISDLAVKGPFDEKGGQMKEGDR